jgi:photosystem II stability/assembly factor-like uncharacterized protein
LLEAAPVFAAGTFAVTKRSNKSGSLGRAAVLAAALAVSAAAAAAAPQAFQDPMNTPAVMSARAARSPLLAVTRAGERLVAVGQRGVVVVSDDQGAHWTQAQVATASDLVTVSFPTAQQGWAAGHDGVILHSVDGGSSWTKQLDGNLAARLAVDAYRKRAEAGDAAAAKALKAAQLDYQNGPDLPFLGIWFDNEREGYAVGSFGLLFATRDGGAHWEPWLDRIDNPQGLNLNSVRGIGGQVYIAAERGTVFRLDRAQQRFVPAATGYAGSFFDLAGTAGSVLAFGLRGTVFRSSDGGSRWEAVKSGVDASLTGGAMLGDGRLVLVSQGGQILLSSDQGRSFALLPAASPGLFAGVAEAGAGQVAVAGLNGIQLEALGKEQR